MAYTKKLKSTRALVLEQKLQEAKTSLTSGSPLQGFMTSTPASILPSMVQGSTISPRLQAQTQEKIPQTALLMREQQESLKVSLLGTL